MRTTAEEKAEKKEERDNLREQIIEHRSQGNTAENTCKHFGITKYKYYALLKEIEYNCTANGQGPLYYRERTESQQNITRKQVPGEKSYEENRSQKYSFSVDKIKPIQLKTDSSEYSRDAFFRELKQIEEDCLRYIKDSKPEVKQQSPRENRPIVKRKTNYVF